MHDFLSRESVAIPLYRKSLDLTGACQVPASDALGHAPQAFVALALFDLGRSGDALKVANTATHGSIIDC